MDLISKDAEGNWIAKPSSSEVPLTRFWKGLEGFPLPPYIREGEMLDTDREQYQTVFARVPGSVAAPTAGLHFSKNLLEKLKLHEITIELHDAPCGIGYFSPDCNRYPCRTQNAFGVGDHWPETVETMHNCRQRGGGLWR